MIYIPLWDFGMIIHLVSYMGEYRVWLCGVYVSTFGTSMEKSTREPPLRGGVRECVVDLSLRRHPSVAVEIVRSVYGLYTVSILGGCALEKCVCDSPKRAIDYIDLQSCASVATANSEIKWIIYGFIADTMWRGYSLINRVFNIYERAIDYSDLSLRWVDLRG